MHALPSVLPQVVESREFELPSDFEDEEIDEESAFTAEDKIKYAGMFGSDEEAPAGGEESDGLLDSDEEPANEPVRHRVLSPMT